MTKTITLIVTWGERETVNLAWILHGRITQTWNQSKQDAQKLLNKLQEDYPDYELYPSVASEYSAWDWLGE